MSVAYRPPQDVKTGDLIRDAGLRGRRMAWAEVLGVSRSPTDRRYVCIKTERGRLRVRDSTTVEVRTPCEGCADFLGQCEGGWSCPGKY